MTPPRFRDRKEAGRQLAEKLAAYANRPDVVVLALPRGGVPVAYEVARALNAPLDVFIVRKLGVPGYEELAMGAIGTGETRVLNDQVVGALQIPTQVIDIVTAQEKQELARRERLYRGGRPLANLEGKTAILVDDGLATGATMHAAIQALRQHKPARIVVAVPTAARDTCEELKKEVDEVICAVTPAPFYGVGYWYEDFSQTSDEEVRELLGRREPPGREDDPEESEPATNAGDRSLHATIRKNAHPVNGSGQDYDPLMNLVGPARFSLLGEASHGTHEFYRERARITRRLIEEKGYMAVAVEADWPDAYRVNRYVRGESDDLDATEALSDFRRFPTWMWRNTEVLDFVTWLRAHNDARQAGTGKVGFYGLDLYSLRASMKAVLQFLQRTDAEAAQRARERYACFDRFGEDAQVYGLIAASGATKSCQEEAVNQLVELQRRAADLARLHPTVTDDDLFYAEQNARLVKNAEVYYRSMFLEEVSSWNLRDRHMVETLEAVVAHLERRGGTAKVAVWEHNSHLGDARATQMGERGELNVGQLVREKYGRDAVLVGFTTHHGTVTAASDWDGPAERKRVRPGRAGSYERLLHEAKPAGFLLNLRDEPTVKEGLRSARLERAIGVIYRPDTELQSHYFNARLSEQFDAVIHFDETQALEPLDRTSGWEAGEVPETFPFAV
jgi:erythromycin esterase-like protein/predicted phosphoribosyltransferase